MKTTPSCTTSRPTGTSPSRRIACREMQATTVLEPGARRREAEALADAAVESSASTARRGWSKSRAAARSRGEVFEADMTHLIWGGPSTARLCPINTLLHLVPASSARHLPTGRRHLERRARYLVQVGLVEAIRTVRRLTWEASRGEKECQLRRVERSSTCAKAFRAAIPDRSPGGATCRESEEVQ